MLFFGFLFDVCWVMCVHGRACVRACVRACARACVRVCVCVCVKKSPSNSHETVLLWFTRKTKKRTAGYGSVLI